VAIDKQERSSRSSIASPRGQGSGEGSGRANSYVHPEVLEQRKPRARAPHQLQPGRHNLSREYVEAHQRQRILDAIADVAGLAGYSAMSVEEIIGAAGVSRRTFYDHFNDKEDAFLAALDATSREMLDRVRTASDASETFGGCVRDCLAAFLEFVAEKPRYAEILIVEVLAAGPAAVACRNELMQTVTEMLRRGAARAAKGGRPPELTAETIIGGIYEVVYSRVLQGREAMLPALLPDLAYSMLLPYLGHEQARREAERPSSEQRTADAA